MSATEVKGRLPLSCFKVLDSGTIQEFDRPLTLLQNKEGALYKMVQQTGQAEALLEAAKQVKVAEIVPVSEACLWLDVLLKG